jgi:hypothetical protein
MLLRAHKKIESASVHWGKTQGTFGEHSVNIQGTFREHLANIQGTFYILMIYCAVVGAEKNRVCLCALGEPNGEQFA